jgi:hypothetical protein
MLVPQAEPFALLSDSAQTGDPVVQEMAPARHGLPATSHTAPAAHAVQIPFAQAMLAPQTVPFDCGRLVSVQLEVPPVAHTFSP